MPDALERIVNLAFYLATAAGPVTAERIREEVEGYPAGQDAEAFLRMFERDKDDLRAAGLAIEVLDTENAAAYRLDRSATFAAEVPLAPAEISALRAVGSALAGDPGFPYADDLRLALAKVMPEMDTGPAAVSLVADESPAAQGACVSVLAAAAEVRKQVTFGYVNSLGEEKSHEVEPYGLFLRDGRWYLVGRDTNLGEVRVYAVSRMKECAANPYQPKHADFERPADFDVRSYVGLPFQYGRGEPFEALLVFSAESAWRSPGLAGGDGTLATRDDGAVEWRVSARDAARLARWVVENGPGIELAAPEAAVDALRDGLARAAKTHA